MTGAHEEQAAQRQKELDAIRQAYAKYREEHRERLWDESNSGYRLIVQGRNGALSQLIAASSPLGAAVLDLGCGAGALASAVRGPERRQWTGVDLLPELLEEARRRLPSARWVEGSADELPFSDGDFEVVIASTLFSSLPSQRLRRAVAREIGRVLRPGGWLIWYDLRYGNPANRAVHGIGGRELGALFPGWEAELRTTTLLPPLARRLGPLTGILYRPLEMLPPLRSHLVGRLKRPRAPSRKGR